MDIACAYCGGELGDNPADVSGVYYQNSQKWSEVHVLHSLCWPCLEAWRKDSEIPGAVAVRRYEAALIKAVRVPRSEASEVRVRLSLMVVKDVIARGAAKAAGERAALPAD